MIAPGATVAIVDGPFRGLEGIYAGMGARERELVLLNVLGAQRPVAVPAHLIAPSPRAQTSRKAGKDDRPAFGLARANRRRHRPAR
jgi:hypothetical protein